MKLYVLLISLLTAAFAVTASAQQAVIGWGGSSGSLSQASGQSGSLSAAAPGAGLTFGTATQNSNSANQSFGIGGTTLGLGGGASGSQSSQDSTSTTVGGSLGSAASTALGGGNSFASGFGGGFGGFGVSLN